MLEKLEGNFLKAGEWSCFPDIGAGPGTGQGHACPCGMSKIIQDWQDMGGMPSILL